MTATQFIEAAVLSYDPPAQIGPGPRLRQKGRLLVITPPPGVTITLDDINASIQADRNGERD